jgi:hypothetical protein
MRSSRSYRKMLLELCSDFIHRNAVFCWTTLLAALGYYNVQLSQLVLLF